MARKAARRSVPPAALALLVALGLLAPAHAHPHSLEELLALPVARLLELPVVPAPSSPAQRASATDRRSA